MTSHNPSYVRRELKSLGYIKVAQSKVPYLTTYWWRNGVMVIVRQVGGVIAVKAAKSYVLRNITEEGETFVRDLANVQDALERFGTGHLNISFLGDATDTLSLSRAKQVMKVPEDQDPDVALAFINKEIDRNAGEIAHAKELRELLKGSESPDGLTKGHLYQQERDLKAKAEELAALARTQRELVDNVADLQRKYKDHGRLSLFKFTYSTPVVVVINSEDFRAALAGVLKEVSDVDLFEIRQKLMGAFKVSVSEIKTPSVFFLGDWEAIDSPRQLACLGQAGFDVLRNEIEALLMVSSNQEITRKDGVVVEPRKSIPAKMFQNVLVRLETAPKSLIDTYSLPKHGGLVGYIMEGGKLSGIPLYYPVRPGIRYASGSTRGGKSYVRAVLCENEIAAGVKNILVIDPTRQATGLTKPTTASGVLERYDALNIPRSYARGFNFRIYTPGSQVGLALPEDLRELLTGFSVVTLKDILLTGDDPDLAACTYVRDILQAVYDGLAAETQDIALSLYLEEAHIFLPAGVRSPAAKEMAGQVLRLLIRIAREKVKYGAAVTLVTQSLGDYRGAGRVVRDMVNYRFFLRSTDKAELEYIESITSREGGGIVKNLNAGEALVSAPGIPGIRTYIRPPLSAVRELSDEEIQGVNQGFGLAQRAAPEVAAGIIYKTDRSPVEEAVLSAARDYLKMYARPISLPELRQQTGLKGGAWQRLLDSMKGKNLVKTVPLPHTGHGRPPLGVIALI